MNHFHELLDQITNESCGCERDISESQEHAIFRWMGRSARSAICFDMGEVDMVTSIDRIPELVRLPYRICWFEGTVVGPERTVVCGALAEALDEADPRKINCIYYKRGSSIKNLWDCRGYFEIRPRVDGVGLAASPPIISEDAQVFACWIACFLSALHCSNVAQREHRPDLKLQKARAKRGKSPLFSFWTLQLTGKDEEGHNLGGTHASPRVHLRRGHPRQYAVGKWTWVQPHAVGNRSAGIVHKDYSASQSLVMAAKQKPC